MPPPSVSPADGDGLFAWRTVPLGRGTTTPRLIRQHKPQYTAEALRAGVPAHGFRVTLLPLAGLVERTTRCFIPVPPERRAHVAQTMVVYVQPTRFSADQRETTRPAVAAREPWLVVLDSGDGHVIFDRALSQCGNVPMVGPAVSLMREQPATTPTLIKTGDFNTAGAIKPGDKGHVEVELTVLPDGRTADLRISRSAGARSAVEAAALAAARTTTYKPATKGGVAVAVRTTLSWGFHFERSDR